MKSRPGVIAVAVLLVSVMNQARALELRAGAIPSVGTVLVSPEFRHGFTAGLPVMGVAARSGHMLLSGFWRWGAAGLSGVDDAQAGPLAPRETALGRSQPNPARWQMTIPVHIAGSNGLAHPTRLEILDVTGRRVALLIDAPLSPGIHTVTWDPRLANGQLGPSGIYLARLHSGSASATARLMLVE